MTFEKSKLGGTLSSKKKKKEKKIWRVPSQKVMLFKTVYSIYLYYVKWYVHIKFCRKHL